jgi:4-hydroxybenzoate polyprenyltransferase
MEVKNLFRNVIKRIADYIKLIRVRQWYKNLVIFLPLFFVGEILNREMLILTLVGFVTLCILSSANYILNDIVDLKNDRIHPEKRTRPLASGNVSVIEAIILFVIMIGISGVLSYKLGMWFLASMILFFIMTTMYTLWLKHEPIIDILMIASNLVIRTVSGVFIIKVLISPWLILCPFFAAIFLAVAKRDADLRLLKGKALNHKKVLKFYTKEVTDSMIIIAATCLIITYSLYALSKTSMMLLTIPFAVYTVLRYYILTIQGSEIARSLEKAYKDVRLMTAVILWGLMLVLVRYILVNSIIKYP